MSEEIPAIHLLKAEAPIILYEFSDRSAAEKRSEELAKIVDQYGLFYSARKDGESYELSEMEFTTSKRRRKICHVPSQPMMVFIEAIIAREGLCAVAIMHRYEVLKILYPVGISIDSVSYVVSDEVC